MTGEHGMFLSKFANCSNFANPQILTTILNCRILAKVFGTEGDQQTRFNQASKAQEKLEDQEQILLLNKGKDQRQPDTQILMTYKGLAIRTIRSDNFNSVSVDLPRKIKTSNLIYSKNCLLCFVNCKFERLKTVRDFDIF